MTTPTVVLTSVVPKDSTLWISWTFSESYENVIAQDINVYDTLNNKLLQYDGGNRNEGKLHRVRNLTNGIVYSVSISVITYDFLSGVESIYTSNSLIGIPEGAPTIIPTITSVVGDEDSLVDGKFNVRVYYNFENSNNYDVNNLAISKVLFKLIDDKTNTIRPISVLASELQKDSENKILVNQYYDLLDTVDGEYDIMCALSNTYGTSSYSEAVSFELFDKPNKPLLESRSGLDSSVLLNIKANNSIISAFAINNIIVTYYDELNPEVKTILNVTPVLINEHVDVDFTVPSLSNGNKYFFEAVAVNVRGESLPSTTVFAYTGLPSKIQNLSLNYVTKTILQAVWEIDNKTYPITELQYVVKDRISNAVLLSNSLPVDSTSLNLSSLNLPEGTEVSVILTSKNNVPSGFVPTVGIITNDVWYIESNVARSLDVIVRATANMVFATSNLSSNSVTFVAKARKSLDGTYPQSQLTGIVFLVRDKLTPEAPFSQIATVDAADFTFVSLGNNVYDAIAKKTINNIDTGSYDIIARSLYSNIDGPLDGAGSKALSVKLPKVTGLTVLELQKSSFKFQLSLDVAESFTSLVLELANRAGSVVVSKRLNYSVNNIYEADFSDAPLSAGFVVLAKVSLENAVDSAFYNVYNDPEAPVSQEIVDGLIKYTSFALADELLVSYKGDVVTESGSDAVMPFKITYPVDNWSLVSQVVLQIAKVGEQWTNAQTLDASTAIVVDGLKTLTGTISGLFNGSSYRARTHIVPKNIVTATLPYSSDEYFSALAVPFKRVEVTGVQLEPKIDETNENCKLKVSTSWSISSGTFSPVYNVVLLSSDNIELSSIEYNSGNLADFELLATDVATSLSISYVNSLDAAQHLYNKQFKLRVIPMILNSVISATDFNTLVLPSQYTISSEYTSYSGLVSSNVSPKTVPGVPTDLALISLNPVKSTIKWNRATETEYNIAVDFVVTLSTTMSFDEGTVTTYVVPRASIVEHRLDMFELLEETTYYVKVLARNALGNGISSSEVTFSTLIALPIMSAITVSQSTSDNDTNVSVDFVKFGTVNGYILQHYELEIFNVIEGVKTKIGDTSILSPDVVLPIIYSGTFGETYSFKVGALFKNVFDEDIVIPPSESQNIVVVDLPVISSINWVTIEHVTTENNVSKAVVEILPNGALDVNIILVAFPSDTSLSVVPFTVSQPTSVNGNTFVYECVLSYYVGDTPKFVLVANNIKGNRYLLEGL